MIKNSNYDEIVGSEGPYNPRTDTGCMRWTARTLLMRCAPCVVSIGHLIPATKMKSPWPRERQGIDRHGRRERQVNMITATKKTNTSMTRKD